VFRVTRLTGTATPATEPHDLFRRHDAIYIIWWVSAAGWGSWFNVSGAVGKPGGQTAAISRYDDHIDLFTVGTDGLVYSTYWDAATGWAGWFQLG
jgi:hypothetical protein